MLSACFKRLHEDARLPTFGTPGSACCDLYILEDTEVPPGKMKFIRTGLVSMTPPGYHWELYLRSSAPRNHPGLILSNHVGIIDSDYCGPADEIKILITNMGVNTIYLDAGERIAQMKLVKNLEFMIGEEIADESLIEKSINRGGFGSTGK